MLVSWNVEKLLKLDYSAHASGSRDRVKVWLARLHRTRCQAYEISSITRSPTCGDRALCLRSRHTPNNREITVPFAIHACGVSVYYA